MKGLYLFDEKEIFKFADGGKIVSANFLKCKYCKLKEI